MAHRSDKILITGAAGLTGRALFARLAAAGHRPMSLDHGGSRVDLRNGEAVAKSLRAAAPDVIVHLAGITTSLHSDISEIYSVNVGGTVNLLEAAASLSRPPGLTILASSATVYGTPTQDGLIAENAPLRPQHHYAASKVAMEALASVFGKSLPILITRPFNYTGAGQSEDFVVAKLVGHFQRREPEIRLGNIDVSRDIGAADDVAEIYCRLIERCQAGATTNIATGRAIALAEIIAALKKLTGHSPKIISDPRFTRPDDPKIVAGDIALLESLIGSVPRTALPDLLSAMLNAH